MSQPESLTNKVQHTIKLADYQTEHLKGLIIDKIRNMFQNFSDEKKDNLIKNLPNFLILIVNNGKTQSEIIDLLGPILGESSGEFVFWFFETLIYLQLLRTEPSKPKEETTQPPSPTTVTEPITTPITTPSDTHAINMANHLVNKFSVKHTESGKVDYNQPITISESQLKNFNNFHELDSVLFPKYSTTSQMNAIKFSSDPTYELGTCCFVVDDGIEPLDTSELIEMSFSNPELKRRPDQHLDEENTLKKTKQ